MSPSLIPADEFRCCVMQMTKNFMQRHSLSLLFWQIFEKKKFILFQAFRDVGCISKRFGRRRSPYLGSSLCNEYFHP